MYGLKKVMNNLIKIGFGKKEIFFSSKIMR